VSRSVRYFSAAAAILALTLAGASMAQQQPQKEKVVPIEGMGSTNLFGAQPGQTEAANGEAKPESGAGGTDWKSEFGFAVGIGYAHLRTPNIESASVHGGAGSGNVVRVDKENNGIPGIWLELHNWWSLKGNRGWGPFIAIQAASSSGSSDAIGSWALGVMYGSKRPTQTTTTDLKPVAIQKEDGTVGKKTDGSPAVAAVPVKTTTTGSTTPSFNIGIAVASMKIQVLGDGLTANQPLPAGITEVYYKTKRMYVPLILASFGF
jgi:hypothetical protein